MISTPATLRARRAHESVVPVFDFLARYRAWTSNPSPTDCDFALGNPQSPPGEDLVSALRDATAPKRPDWYAYKMSEPSAREAVCGSLLRWTGETYEPEDVFLTNGATGALMVAMNALLEDGDEVIFPSPPWFFYEGMIANFGGKPVRVSVRSDGFDLDLNAIAAAITERTRLLIVNSPNNPTGKVYPRETLARLGELLEDASRRTGRVIYLVSDEAYRTIVFDGIEYASPTSVYPHSILVYTYGKALLAPGQRLGYLALSPRLGDRPALREAMTSSQILCGWAMASALMQHALPRLADLSLDVGALQSRRDRFVSGLREAGYDVVPPGGGFYLTPKTPVEDDAAFANELAKERVFCLPGRVVHMPGHLRVSLTASDEMIDRALPRFAEAARRFAR